MKNMKKILLVLLTGLVLAIALAGVAQAWTPQNIYDDWADNGKLDRQYTTQDLQAYLNDPTVHQYGDSSILVPLDSYVTKTTGQSGRTTFPWTGAQIAAIVLAAALLISLGVLLRRTSRQKQQR